MTILCGMEKLLCPSARALYESYMTIPEVAKSLGVSIPAARRAIVDQGGTIRSRTWKKRPSGVDLTVARELYESGLSMNEVGKRMGFAGEYVRILLKKSGYKARVGGTPGSKNYFWKGGRVVDKHGYILVKRNDHPCATRSGYVREHRLVMEQKIGRILDPKEVVHHLDGNPQNNHPDNLHLYGSNKDHLAETLKGKCPNWTPEGRDRIRSGARERGLKGSAIRWGSRTGVSG